ncbi:MULTISPECIES: potassium/proton antiporter [Rhizobium]|uniref:Cell volume regulation protein A homolog n=1 Tax=Rhizobium favelukesii TaxID=348824 RepID=W6RXX0_9HYPH|nr:MULTISPECIES: potassium/proton antiporter [Rhizobium]MCA0803150.1 potassium/proton antiporter [Rhizobium sp. T1473]MCS0461143.1 potassium/proton antiporter [Rhizobium favelukesii]UFS83314.1 potassium/proton antiporter [Rhizobium sp. T136]CDM59116.1 Cell volume regulation protein A homolog [Rhizobium favelukesii]
MEAFYIVVLVSTTLVLLAAFSSLLAFRFGAPLLLLFLAIGLLAGTDGLGIEFTNNYLAYILGSIALAVILFDSGFGTPVQAFKLAAIPSLTLASVGVLITAALIGVAAMWMLNFTFLEGLLLGSIVASTDAAAVFFLLRIGGINIRDKVRSTLEVESGTNDPMAIFLTIALVEILASGERYHGINIGMLAMFVQQMGLGVILGLLGGMMIVLIVSKLETDRGLTPIFVLALALLVFSATGAVGGSGFLAVYVAGIYAGNRRLHGYAAIKRFQDGMTWLAQIIMFLVLGLLATPSQFPAIAIPAVLLALFLIFIARPLAIWLSLLPFDYTQQEIGFVAWVGLRGAVSILLAIMPILGGLENGQVYFNTAFIIVLVSLLVQGWTIKPVAKKLGLIIPPRMGAVDKVEVDLPGAANHELLSYRVVKDSPVLRGERIPRWATPSLVIRDGKSMRYQYAGRLRENDLVYLFVVPSYSRLLDKLFASRAPVEEDDADFFGAFALSPARPAADLDAAYGPGLLNESEKGLTIAELMKHRLGGKADYADRVRLGSIILIVRDLDDHDHITSVGMSLEALEPATALPIFLNLHDIIDRIHERFKGRRNREAAASAASGKGDENPQ